MSNDISKRLRLNLGLGDNVLPGVEAIGSTYNPFSGCASADNLVAPIFDWKKDDQDTFTNHGHEYSKPASVYAVPRETSDSTQVFGETIESYQEDLAAQVSITGSYAFFSGSLRTDFSSESMRKSETSFSRVNQTINTWSLQITVDASLRSLLKEPFKKALDTIDIDSSAACEEFFSKYGSHFLSGIVVGGSATRTAATDKTTVSHSYDLKVVAKESFGFASGQLSSDQDVEYKTAVSSFESNSTIRTHIQGGDSTLGDRVFSGNPDSDKWTEWTQSVREAPVFVQLTGQNPLAPIWALCDTTSSGKRVSQGLQEYYESTWAPNWSNRLLVRPDYIDAITIVTGGANTAATPGYTKVDVDLNRNAEGDYIYLCYHKTPYSSLKPNPPAITDFYVLFGRGDAPSGYEKINVDLNKGAGGSYIYLCIKHGAYDPKTAIVGVTAVTGTSSNLPVPYGYTRSKGISTKVLMVIISTWQL